MNNENQETYGEEVEGEQLYPQYVCLKREVPEEEICESESSCSEARTTTGNILERMITDPLCRRPPCLGRWPVYPPKSESNLEENIHQYRAAQQSTVLGQMCSLRVTSTPNIFRQPAVIGTIGPATWDVPAIVELIEAGMNIARISMSHIYPCSSVEPFQNIIEASNQYKTMRDYDIPIGIMMELKGSEIRTGKIDFVKHFITVCANEKMPFPLEIFRDRKSKEVMNKNLIPEKEKPSRKIKSQDIYLKQGTTVRLTVDKAFEERCTDRMIFIDYEELVMEVETGMIIFISGGEIKLRVDSVEKTSVVCIVEKEGKLRSNQKIYIPSLPILRPALSNYDKECLELAVKMDLDVIAVPKTRNEVVIKEVKRYLDELQEENNIIVLSKISNYEGLENIDSILRTADGVILEKNDLILEISPEKILIAQKEIIGKCNRVGKPVVCTAQLSSVISSDNVSQRMEMSDIGGAIIDGADGIMLASETALGDQGAQVITQLSNVIREAEAATMQQPFYFDLAKEQVPSIEPCKAIAMAAVQIASKIQASAILAVTTSGRTAHMLSWFRPRAPVIAISRNGKTSRQMNLWRCVIPLHFSAPLLPDWFHDVKARFEYGIAYGKECGIIKSGDLLVLVSGFRRKSGFTNCIRIVFASLEKDAFVDNVNEYYGEVRQNLSSRIV